MSDPNEDWARGFIDEEPSASSFLTNIYGNGEDWVAVGYREIPGYSYGPLIVSSDALEGPWSVAYPTSEDADANDVVFADGIWTVVGSDYSLYFGTTIFTSTNPAGGWTRQSSWAHAGTAPASGTGPRIDYGDGVWVVATGSGEVYTASDPTSTFSLSVDLVSEFGGGVMSALRYIGGQWAITWTRTVNGSDVVSILTADNPAGAWAVASTLTPDASGLAYSLGEYPGGFYVGVPSGIWTASSLNGAWTQAFDFNAEFPDYFLGVEYGGGDWVAAGNDDEGNAVVLVASSPAGPFTAVTVEASDEGGFAAYFRPHYNGEDWASAGISGDLGAVWAPAAGTSEGWGLTL